MEGLSGQKGYIVAAARAAVQKQENITDAQFDAGGWTITVNIDRKKQQELEKSVKAKLTDKLDTKGRKLDQDVQAGAVSVDPKTGGVLAMYGGRGLTQHYISNATRRDYQPASTFKPVILAAALDQESQTQDDQQITADTRYDGTSKRPVVGSDRAFAPENEDDQDYGQVTVQTAMNKSINSVFAQMGVDVGMDRVLQTAGKLGMDVKGLAAVPSPDPRLHGCEPDGDGRGLRHPRQPRQEGHTADREVGPEAGRVTDRAARRDRRPGHQAPGRGLRDLRADRCGRRRYGPRRGTQCRGAVRPADRGQDRHLGRQQVGLVHRLHPRMVTSVGLFGEAAYARTGDDGKKIGKGAQVPLKGAGGGRVNGGGFPADIWASFTAQAMGDPGEFDLDTDMGAAVTPPSPSITPSTSASPSDEATPSHTASSPPASSHPPKESTSPSSTPPSPSDDPTSDPPPDPSTDPDPSDSAEVPVDPGGDQPNSDNSLTQ